MKINKDKNLAHLTNFKIGGKAKFFVEVFNLSDIETLIKDNFLVKAKKFFIFGDGTNILINNFDGLIIKSNINFIKHSQQDILEVGSGVKVSALLSYAIEKNLAGLEWAGGLPGSVGGAIEGGVGCFGQEFKNLVIEVTAVDLNKGSIERFSQKDCQFAYRDSFFRRNRQWFIISSSLRFHINHNKEELIAQAKEKIFYRQNKHPLDFPNAGSIFKNYPFAKAPKFLQDFVLEKNKLKNDPFPVIPIAFLIAEAGLKGKQIGGAQISEKHCNFIINRCHATFDDVMQLIDFTKRTIEDKFSISPELEIQIVR